MRDNDFLPNARLAAAQNEFGLLRIGWQLGEHGEWAKITNFEFATHAPLMIHDPEQTRGRMVASDMYTEHVDLLPTLAELALGVIVPACGSASSSFQTKECTEGVSLVPLMSAPTVAVKLSSFSQFPRPISGMRATAAWVRIA
eukprot:SAG31_NODE_734_length_12489_cov_6.922034_2_plen_143_part_00